MLAIELTVEYHLLNLMITWPTESCDSELPSSITRDHHNKYYQLGKKLNLKYNFY